MTGILTLAQDPISPNDAATKTYVDSIGTVASWAGAATGAPGSPARRRRPSIQLIIDAPMITPAHRDRFQDVPPVSSIATRSAAAKVPAITAQSDAEGRPGRRALQASQASPARPVAIATGSK